MSWGETIGVVLLTTVAGGGAALGLAAFIIKWHHISNFEGGAGYFSIVVTLAGLGSGFCVGLVTALTLRSAFWLVQVRALEIVAGLTLVAGILSVVVPALRDEGPRLEGDPIVLEVELQTPRDWDPGPQASARYWSCVLADRPGKAAAGNRNGGSAVFKPPAPGPDRKWVVPCAFLLERTSGKRFVRLRLRHKLDVTVQVPLPRHPGAEFAQWSQWSSAGVVPGKDGPAADCQFRFRIQRAKNFDKALSEHRAAFVKARRKALSALPPRGPLAQWLPFFESEEQGRLEVGDSAREIIGPAEKAVQARPAELATLLRSSDNDVARRAIFAAACLESVPESLIEPLAASGRHTIALIREARAGSLPNDPDWIAAATANSFFRNWRSLIESAGTAAVPARRAVLEEIERELHGETGDWELSHLAERVRRDLEQLNAAAR